MSISLLEAGLLLAMTIEVIRSFLVVRIAKRLESRRKPKSSEGD